jgi:hypothetical protein
MIEACHVETGNDGTDAADPDRGGSDAGVGNAAQTVTPQQGYFCVHTDDELVAKP